MRMLGLYVVYYLGLPAILAYFYFNLKRKAGLVDFLSDVDHNRGMESSRRTKMAKKSRRRTKTVFVVVLLLFLCCWHLVTSEVVDLRLKSEVRYGGAGIYADNPISVSLGPTYDVEGAIRTIKEKENRWLPNRVEEVVNLDNLKNKWGRIAVYRTYDQRYVITLTYLSPWPVIRSYGFQYVEIEGGRKKIIKKEKKTVFYPLDPGSVDETGKL